MKTYTGSPWQRLPPELRDALAPMDRFLRDIGPALGRISLGRLPDGSGAAIGSPRVGVSADKTAFTDYLYLPGLGSAQTVNGDVIFTNLVTVSGVLTVSDDFIIYDSADATKQAEFICAAITTGTLRAFTFPDGNTVLAGRDLAQTFTQTQSITPPSATYAALNSTYTDTVAVAAAAGSNLGIWNLAPTLSSSSGGINALEVNALAVVPTLSNIIDSTIVGIRAVVTGSLDAADAGFTSLSAMSFRAVTAGTSGSFWLAVTGAGGVLVHGSGDAITTATGLSSQVTLNASSGLVTTARGLNIGTTIAGSCTTWQGIRVNNPTGAGTPTTAIGISLASITDGTTNYAIDSAGGQSRHVGNLFVGAATDPTAKVHLGAGTTAASTAPLKFTTGTSMTTAEAGALEFTTDDFFATITTGAARKAFILDDGARLTSGKIPVATTNGRLIDGQTPLSGTKVYYVSDTALGLVNRKLTFINGILTAET